MHYNKEDEIHFAVPLASVSTNNRALINVAAGIAEGFVKICDKDNPFRSVWVNAKDNSFYSPLIKTYQSSDDPNAQFITDTSSLISMCSELESLAPSFFKSYKWNFFKSFKDVHFEDIENASVLLPKIISFLHLRLKKSIDDTSKVSSEIKSYASEFSEFQKDFIVNNKALFDEYSSFPEKKMILFVEAIEQYDLEISSKNKLIASLKMLSHSIHEKKIEKEERKKEFEAFIKIHDEQIKTYREKTLPRIVLKQEESLSRELLHSFNE
jgi:hypothetical protein